MIRKLKLIKTLCGEGDFHVYELLIKRRLFLCLKFFCMVCKYSFSDEGKGEEIVYAIGNNQDRLSKFYYSKIKHDYINIEIIKSDLFRFNNDFLKGFGLYKFIALTFNVLLILLTGKKRYLHIFVLNYYNEIIKSLKARRDPVKAFICFNDQPLEVAAIVLALRDIGEGTTIVIQHGLILSERFYFPVNAHEFWAWGNTSGYGFKSRFKYCKFLVKGRYTCDQANLNPNWLFASDKRICILLAPSYSHKEIFDLIKCLMVSDLRYNKNISLAIKMHPATKFKIIIKMLILISPLKITEEKEVMEILSKKYDCLFTKNSTSGIDFLLLGKPVFFLEIKASSYPSNDYGFLIGEFSKVVGDYEILNFKNSGRLSFLREVLSVKN